jgi:alpha-tubulin suppressor-like RCC1 family protein
LVTREIPVIKRTLVVCGCVGLAGASANVGHAASVAAGSTHSAVVNTTNGTAWGWGANANGQIGDSSTTLRRTAVQASGLTDVVMVAAGASHTLFLKSNGTVWASGSNANGRLGDGTTTQRTSPVQVTGLTGVISIAAGDAHSLACKSDGSLWAWGYNAYGRLGDGTTTDRWSPVPVSTLSGVVKVAAGASHSLAITSDGNLWSWGYNNWGQLGEGTTTSRSAPVQVSTLSGVAGVAGGGSHSLAVTSDGSTWAWGYNFYGQLGDGTNQQSSAPVAVSGLSNVVAVSAGNMHSVALAADGVIRAWGWNLYGQLGDGTGEDSSVPELIYGIPAVAVVAAASHTLAVTTDNVVWAWGRNSSSQIGDGTTENRLAPVAISAPGFVWKVATPTFSVASGTYTTTKSVTLSCYTTGATIRYTTDGTDPTSASALYTTAISVTQTTVLKARAFKAGMPDSNVGRADYTLMVATPTITPGGGTFDTPRTVTIACSVAGATIRYTTSGADPSETDSVIASGGTITVDASQTVKAKAWKAGWLESAVVSKTFTMVVATPTMAPSGGSYTSSQTVTLSTTTPGATVHYTTDGVEPGPADPAGTTVVVDRSLTLRAAGFRAGWTTSQTIVQTYWLSLGAAAAPAFSPPGGAYDVAQTVSVSSATSGAAIRYTLDGTEPSLSSAAYVSPLVISAGATIRARAFKVDHTPSATSTAVYTIGSGVAAPPLIAPGSGTYAAGLTVTITTQTPGAILRYTTDGTDPDEDDPVVASGVSLPIAQSARVKARAWKEGLAASPAATADYLLLGDVAAGDLWSLVLAADGGVWAFGDNAYGQLGTGNLTDSWVPVQVLTATGPLADVVSVAAGSYHGLAVTADRRVWAWGRNDAGQAGDGTTQTPRMTAVQVLTASGPLTDVVAVAAGELHSLALKADGSIWAWGAGSSGQLGDGSTTGRSLAAPVPSLASVLAIAAGGKQNAVIALGAGSTDLWAWGANNLGQLGDGSSIDRTRPIRVGVGVAAVRCGGDFTLRVRADGVVVGTGANDWGQLADGTTTSPRLSPVAAMGPPGLTRIAAGANHTLALHADGTVWGAGRNYYGELGDVTTEDRTTFVSAAWLADVVAIAAGQDHSLALDRSGRVHAWGMDYYGQLGLGDRVDRHAPTVLPDLTAADQSWPEADPDGDGLTTAEEILIGSDPLLFDTNGDGIADGVAVRSGLSATAPDMDLDGIPNWLERTAGTDPLRSDTDEDGTPDGTDCYPLDPGRSVCPPPDPGDHVPPAITLSEPATATLISSTP